MKITISHNFPEVKRSLDRMRQDIGSKALASAVNKTIEQARTRMVREITSEYRVTSGYVRERLSIRRARFTSGVFGLSAELIGGNGRRRSANLIRFVEQVVSLAEARRRAKSGTLPQLRFQVRKVGGKKVVKGAFIGNKGRTVFIRTSDKRLPIRPLQTIDVAQMFNQKKINAAVVGVIKDRFPTIFEREARFYVDRFNRG
jgi:hypothetical protein